MSAWRHATSFSVQGVGVCNLSTGGEDEKTRDGAEKHTRKIRIDTEKSILGVGVIVFAALS